MVCHLVEYSQKFDRLLAYCDRICNAQYCIVFKSPHIIIWCIIGGMPSDIWDVIRWQNCREDHYPAMTLVSKIMQRTIKFESLGRAKYRYKNYSLFSRRRAIHRLVFSSIWLHINHLSWFLVYCNDKYICIYADSTG